MGAALGTRTAQHQCLHVSSVPAQCPTAGAGQHVCSNRCSGNRTPAGWLAAESHLGVLVKLFVHFITADVLQRRPEREQRLRGCAKVQQIKVRENVATGPTARATAPQSSRAQAASGTSVLQAECSCNHLGGELQDGWRRNRAVINHMLGLVVVNPLPAARVSVPHVTH